MLFNHLRGKAELERRGNFENLRGLEL